MAHEKRKKLRNVKFFVLDNSLRESTVGQVVGHSLHDKFTVLEAADSVGFKDQIVGSFSSMRRVDDAFCEELLKRDNAGKNYYAFSEDTDKVVDGEMLFGPDHIPTGLAKCAKYGIPSCIFEVDVADPSIDWDGKFPISKFMEMMTFLLEWSHANLVKPGDPLPKNMLNLRDLPFAMLKCPERTLEIVGQLGQLPSDIRPDALIFEEPVGEYFPEEVAGWTQLLRKAMDDNGWTSKFQQDGTPDGMLLFHSHKQWGMADASVLDFMAAGGDGVWSSIAEEGAAMGHACSAVTIANLARLGNKDVVTRYNSKNIAKAARAVTESVTNKPTHPRQIVYGSRAVEAVFGFAGIAGGKRDPTEDFDGDGVIDDIDHFTLADFLGVEDPPVRISTLASAELVAHRLEQCFGENAAFTQEAAGKLVTKMKEQLENNMEREHTSPLGLALLWKDTFGDYEPGMEDIVKKNDKHYEEHKELLKNAKTCFEEYLDHDVTVDADTSLPFDQFYEAYLRPYVGCFTCPRTRFVLDAIDLDDDGSVTWDEWRTWCTWALREYPDEIANLDDLHNVVLRQAIIPLSLSQASSAGAE